ncbi:nuclear transport factor 2 family protein [Alteromonas sp. a30]|uniref:nuclear transport factor 2 family protein n=1 Tax=Alteromonas sp. a30 TaxID=2730917 RepID=UPI00227E0AF0|nr:nuclear transport factor 2 family protein [Alteromonas sp. a30]MCY7295864.1 nuclear transport factor 2 family protein [Alteromonas sp. a30]
MLRKGVLGLMLMASSCAYANDKSELKQLLDDFLANTIQDDLKNHQQFWANDLIYTSSAGKRFGKSSIINGIKAEQAAKKEHEKSDSEPSYWAEDTDIRLYGTTAIVAFKLGAEWVEDDVELQQFYYNTGTFLKRNGKWQVVAWQATKIPESLSEN